MERDREMAEGMSLALIAQEVDPAAISSPGPAMYPAPYPAIFSPGPRA